MWTFERKEYTIYGNFVFQPNWKTKTVLDIPMDTLDNNEPVVVLEEFDEVEMEAKRTEAPRCTKCKRMTSGHEGPYGSKCDLKILSEEDLKEDDLKKLKAKEIKKAAKRKSEHGDENEALKKKKSRQKKIN